MRPDIVDIDHVMVQCESLYAATTHFEKLGFTVRKPRFHEVSAESAESEPFGSTVVSFASSDNTSANYLELSFNPSPTENSTAHSNQSGGVALIMLAISDIKKLLPDWQAIPGHNPQPFKLPMEPRDNVPAQTIQGAVQTTDESQSAVGIVSYEHTLEYQLPELTSHSNSALHLKALHYTSNETGSDRLVEVLSELLGEPRDDLNVDGKFWEFNQTEIRVYDTDGFRARFGDEAVSPHLRYAMTIEVESIEKTRSCLDNSGISYLMKNGGADGQNSLLVRASKLPLLEFSQI